MNQQAITTILVAIALAAGAGSVLLLLPGIQQDQSVDEIVIISNSSSRAVFTLGAANINNCQALVENGYLDSSYFTDCVNENIFGNNITAVGNATTNSVALTYGFDSLNQCNYALANLDQRVPELIGTPSCNAANTLSWQVRAIRQ